MALVRNRGGFVGFKMLKLLPIGLVSSLVRIVGKG